MTEQTPEAVKGFVKAGILLTAFGKDQSSEILKFFSANEIRRMGVRMFKFPGTSREDEEAVLREFCKLMEGHSAGAKDYLLDLLTTSLGEERKEEGDEGGLSPELQALKWMEPQAIFNIIRNEHPQAIAVILSQLSKEQGLGILTQLPDAVRNEVMLRMATLQDVPPGVIQEISEVLQTEFTKMGEEEMAASKAASKKAEGARQVAALLSEMTPSVEEKAMASIKESNPELAMEIRELMFIFDDIIKLDDRGMQTLLKDVSKDDLALAIRGAKDELKEKIYKNMSQRAAEMMKEDIEAKGPVKRSDMEKAQQAVVKLTLKLMDSGEVFIKREGGVEGESEAMV